MLDKFILVQNEEQDREMYLKFRDALVLGIDTETSGLSFVNNVLWSVQVSDGNICALYDHSSGKTYKFLNQFLKSPNTLKVGHSIAFDLKFLWKAGYNVQNVQCTKVTEQVISAGKADNFSLKSTLENNLGVVLSKEERKDFYAVYSKAPTAKNPVGVLNENYFGINKKWTPELIEYACKDVLYLPSLHQNQLERAKEADLQKTVNLEKVLTRDIALAEYRGVYIDLEALDSFEKDMLAIAASHSQKVLSALEDSYKAWYEKEYEKSSRLWEEWNNNYQQLLKDTNKRVDRKVPEENMAKRRLFKKLEPKKLPEYAGLNLDSVDQVKRALSIAGIDVPNLTKDTLEELRGFHEVVDYYLDYNKYGKLAEFAKIREKVEEGLIHCSLNQNGTETGRMSCSSPNLQNQPARSEEGKRLRSCFKAREGNTLLVADYSAIELVIIGVLADDERILTAINEGKDLHLWTMHYLLNCPYEALLHCRETGESTEKVDEAIASFKEVMPLSQIESYTGKKYINAFRDYLKTLTYGMAYGLSEFGLSRKFKCALVSARELIQLFFSVYPKVKDFLQKEGELGYKNGFSVNINGRRRYYRIKPMPARRDFSNVDLYKQALKAYYAQERRVQRQAANFSIQSVSADITKLAYAKYSKKLRDNKVPEQYGIILAVHDEIVPEVPLELAELAKKLLIESMQEAAYQILGNKAIITVDAHETIVWKK